jgi:putative beta-lysine N-acetyltransferase
LNIDKTQELIAKLDEMALKNGYEKIFAKIPAPAWDAFKSVDYVKEAVIPGFFNGKIDGFFIAKYFSTQRQIAKEFVQNPFWSVNQNQKEPAIRKHRNKAATRYVVKCKPADAEEMSALYQQVFKSYPFPIHNPNHLKHMMDKGVIYYCIRIGGRIAALAAAEIDPVSVNVEMTDFATLPNWRNTGFAGILLRHMNRKTCELGIKTAYTIARAASCGMNLVFQNNGYNYAGLLKNNSQICGSIQSMTVWYKHL